MHKEPDFHLVMHQKPFVGQALHGPSEKLAVLLQTWMWEDTPGAREGTHMEGSERNGEKGMRKEQKGKGRLGGKGTRFHTGTSLFILPALPAVNVLSEWHCLRNHAR